MKLISVKTILGLSGLLLFACNNEDFNERGEVGNPSDYISFGVTPADGVQTKGVTRADAKEYVAGSFVLRSADSADTLCVRTIISDGIQGAAIGEKPITRGKPLNPGDEFYEAFHVLTIQDGSKTEFFMNDDVKKGTYTEGVWETDKTYYWPGKGELKFYAWAPIEGSFTSKPTSPAELKFGYTVPTNVEAQKDIVVAQTPCAGDFKQAVPLSFKHICTAVRFVVGAQMQPGTIQSISLNGVYNAGTYDMSGLSETSPGSWELIGTGNFKQSLKDGTMTGEESQGDEITLVDGTFMMLPQILPSGAEVVVEFQDEATGNLRTLRASIAGSEWPMGKTVTYQLAITPEYNISIECDDVVDAHYVIQKIQVNADCDWELSSDYEWLTFTDFDYDSSDQLSKPLGLNGYWVREERGEKTYQGSGNKVIYAYYDENLSDADRVAEIKVSVRPSSSVTIPWDSKLITQYCPAWNGNKGLERIEEDTNTYPFGFAWDRKVSFTARPGWSGSSFSEILSNLFGAYVFRSIAQDVITEYGAGDYVTVTEENQRILFWTFLVATTVTIDYSKINNIGNDNISRDNGLDNTHYLYTFRNIGQVSTIENRLRDNAVGNFTEDVTEDSHGDLPIEQFAVRIASKKNEYRKVLRETSDGQTTVKYYEAVIDPNEDEFYWYLPAIDEWPILKVTDKPLDGTYWSSTAASDSENAYSYASTLGSAEENRMNVHKIRAAVTKP